MMLYKRSAFLPFLLALAGCATSKPQRRPPQPTTEVIYQNPNPAPPRSRARNIVVPDSQTAIRIAKAVWAPVYGEAVVQAGKNYDAVLNNGIWTVTAKFLAGAMDQGTAIMDISQEDGRISKIAHGQFVPGREWR